MKSLRRTEIFTSCETSFKYLGDGRGMAKLAMPQRAVTPGQSAVFYKENYLACGGFIY